MHHDNVARPLDTRSPGRDAPLSADGTDAALTIRRGAKALVRSGDQVLLIRERREDGSTFWTLPGGGVEPGETLRDCLQREFLEELDCRVDVGSPVATCIYQHRSIPDTVTLYSVFDADVGARPQPNKREGVVDYEWRLRTEPPANTLDPFERVLADLAGQL